MHQGGRKLGNWKLELYLNHNLKRNCFGHYKKLADSRSYIYTMLIRKPCSVKTTKSMSQKVYKGNFTEVKTWDFHNFSVKQVTIGSHSFWSRIWSPINLITLIFKKKSLSVLPASLQESGTKNQMWVYQFGCVLF